MAGGSVVGELDEWGKRGRIAKQEGLWFEASELTDYIFNSTC